MSIKQKIYITVDALVLFKQKHQQFLLLIKRKNNPFKNQWALPGGFVDNDELVVNACQRELKEETGLDLNVNNFHFLDYYDQPDRDPRSRTVTFAFIVYIEHKIEVEGNDDAVEACWFDLNDLPELAFDHSKIIKATLNTIS